MDNYSQNFLIATIISLILLICLVVLRKKLKAKYSSKSNLLIKILAILILAFALMTFYWIICIVVQNISFFDGSNWTYEPM